MLTLLGKIAEIDGRGLVSMSERVVTTAKESKNWNAPGILSRTSGNLGETARGEGRRATARLLSSLLVAQLCAALGCRVAPTRPPDAKFANCEAIHEPTGPQQGPVIVSPRSLHFGWQTIGRESIERPVELRNVGTTAVTVLGIAIPPHFLLKSAPSVPVVLAPQSTTRFVITFSPDSSANDCFEGQLDFALDSGNLSVLLAGAGLYETRIMNIDPFRLDVGEQRVGTSVSREILFWNGGTEEVESVSAMGIVSGAADRPPWFSMSEFHGLASLRVGDSFAVQVTFSPRARGEVTDFLAMGVEGHGLAGDAALPLIGVGVP